MEDKIEKIMNSPGYKNRYQYFVGGLIFLSWIFANMITASLAYLENTSKVRYFDKEKNEEIEESLSYDICEKYKDNYEIVETYGYSWVIDAGIECDRTKVSLIGTVCYTGNMLGALFYTFLSKLFGLKKTLVIGLLFMGTAVIVSALLKQFWFNIVLCIIGNIGCNTICYSSIQLSSEFVHPDLRSIFNAFTNIGYTLSGILFIFFYWFIDSWTVSFYIGGLAMISEGIFCIFFLTNSPREALYRDVDEFLDILDRIAKFNGRLKEHEHNMILPEYKMIILELRREYGFNKYNPIDTASPQYLESPVIEANNDIISPEPIEIEGRKEFNKAQDHPNSQVKTKSTLVSVTNVIENEGNLKGKKLSEQTSERSDTLRASSSNEIQGGRAKEVQTIQLKSQVIKKNVKIPWYAIFKYKSIRTKMILSSLAWFLDRIVYEGIAIGIKNLPGNIYSNGIIFYILETISYFLSGFIMEKKRIGRKKTALIGLFGSTALFLSVAFLFSYETPSLILSLICRFTITMAYGVFSVYCLEIYPTPVRAIGYGITSIFNNIGGIIIPLIVEQVSHRTINFIFAILSGSNGVLMFFLEETVGKPMPETIKELEEEKSKRRRGNVRSEDKDREAVKIELQVSGEKESKESKE